ncbi:MAG: 4-hydroxythreonine-4-phosphate dehydrogenase 2 [Elusimicrobia bacterium ADurb.Bin231]|nr:MAG: 4-hydroxythreonine-4-phosphate dehydrogenase 2 [Elusimicrobia bacterium ADurb.Bin231]
MFKPIIAITAGDPAGVGPEIIKKALSEKEIKNICVPIPIGLNKKAIPGKHTPANDKHVVQSIKKALYLIKTGQADGLVTGPAAKSAFNGKGYTEFLANATGSKQVEMLMVSGRRKVLLLTRHIPLKTVSRNLSIKEISKSVELTVDFIKNYFIRQNHAPKVAFCGLNPHISDGGLVGNEESKIILPAIQSLIKQGINASGPWPAESVFMKSASAFDLIVCLYHDQAMLPLKLLSWKKIVNVSIGLPFIRTSPGHGTAYDIAGTGTAEYMPMMEAIKLAVYLTNQNIKNKIINYGCSGT